MKIEPLYLNPHLARTREPSAYENQLADAMERAFGQSHWEIDALVASLNESGPLATGGLAWTAQSFSAELKRLSLS